MPFIEWKSSQTSVIRPQKPELLELKEPLETHNAGKWGNEGEDNECQIECLEKWNYETLG